MTQPGYEIGRNDEGLTERERKVLDLLLKGWTQKDVAVEIGVTKQRVTQLVQSMVKKDVLRRDDGRLWVPLDLINS